MKIQQIRRDANNAAQNPLTFESLSTDETKILRICGITSMDGDPNLREIGFWMFRRIAFGIRLARPTKAYSIMSSCPY